MTNRLTFLIGIALTIAVYSILDWASTSPAFN